MSHSWHPIDLGAVPRVAATRPGTGGLVYPGGRHLLSGEPESGKSLFAMALAVTEVRAGNVVAWVDRESDEQFVAERLRCFAVTADELERFAYFRPVDPVGAKGVAETIAAFVAERQPAIVVFDAFAGLLDLHDLDGNKAADVERGYRAIIEPWRVEGAATIVIDHVVKSRGDRGRFASGSERKLGAVDVHIGLDVIDAFGRGRTGRAKLVIHKDRSGFLPRPRFSDFVLASDDEGLVTACTIEPAADTEGGGFRPTHLMEKVSGYLERQTEPVTRRDTKHNVPGKGEWVVKAIDFLIIDGYVAETIGGHGAKLLSSIKPYPDPDLAVPSCSRPEEAPGIREHLGTAEEQNDRNTNSHTGSSCSRTAGNSWEQDDEGPRQPSCSLFPVSNTGTGTGSRPTLTTEQRQALKAEVNQAARDRADQPIPPDPNFLNESDPT